MVLSHWWTRHVESRKRGLSQVKSRDLFLFLRPMQYRGYALRIEWPKPLSFSGGMTVDFGECLPTSRRAFALVGSSD
jgi:hypothetical protein